MYCSIYLIFQPRVLWLYLGLEHEGFHVGDMKTCTFLGYPSVW
jgi:hypothetical protein